MRSLFIFTVLVWVSMVPLERVVVDASLSQAAASTQLDDPTGRWQVKFYLSGVGEKKLILESKANGAGSFLLLDAGVDNAPSSNPLTASWSQATNDRVNFSGEAELPLGTCCREVGTLVFKGKFKTNNSISGKAIFIGSTEDEENYNGFRSMTGTFVATRDAANH